MSEGLDGDEGWSDYEEEEDEGYSGGSATIGGDSSYQGSALEDNSLKGTVISGKRADADQPPEQR